MPCRTDTRTRVADVADAAIHLIDTVGVAAVTVRALAATLRMSASTLLAHLEHQQRILDLVTRTVGRQLLDRCSVVGRLYGLAALVPDDEEARVVAAWFALRDLARTDEQRSLGRRTPRRSSTG